MRVLTYNIFCGGDDRQMDENRRPKILTILKIARPDILALQEANGFDDPSVLQYFSDQLSLPYFALSKGALYEDAEHYNVVLLSRYRLSDIHHFDECSLQSAALSAIIDTPVGPLSFCVVHLHAFDERKRLEELSCLLAHQKKYRDQVLLGDFNAISRAAQHPLDTREFELSYMVTDMLSDAYVDVCAQETEARQPTFPTELKTGENKTEPRRIDYIFTSKDFRLTVTNKQTLNSTDARTASDHFPLMVDFEV